MPDLDRYRPSALAHSISQAGPAHTSHSAAHIASARHHGAASTLVKADSVSRTRTTISPVLTNVSSNSNSNSHASQPLSGPSRYLAHIQHDALHCKKPLPSVPKDVDEDDGLDDDDGSELVHHPLRNQQHHQHYPRPSLHSDIIESDISSASASSSTTSSSMETDWYESSLRNQVARLPIQYTDVDLAQTEAPSVFGLRRRIVAAALDHVSRSRQDGDEAVSEIQHFDERGLSEWLAQQPSSSQWKDKILRKKISFGKKHAAKALTGQQTLVHDPMPNGATSPADSVGRSRSSSMAGSASSHDKMLKRDRELAEREANFDLVVLSRFETAELKMMVYTEHRQGSWVVQGPADPRQPVLDEPPLVYSPWDCQIDSRAIVERKKLRSFVELSDTTCVVRCTTCSSPHHRRLGQGYDVYRKNLIHARGDGVVGCKHCEGSGAVKATYVVCVTLRQSTFLPLTMPARHRAGKHQRAFRSYLPRTTKALSHVDVLRMRSLEAVRSCALRVGRAHHKEHDARLLMAKATLERRSCNSVAVINKGNGVFRTFDITDGGCVRGHAGAGLTEEESRIVETPELADALSRLPVTAVVHPEATYRFIDLELVDMATSKQLSFLMMEESRSPSIYTNGSSTDDSYSPTALSFFQRATTQPPNRYGGNDHSRDSQTLRGSYGSQDAGKARSAPAPAHAKGEEEADSSTRWQLPPLNTGAAGASSLSSCSPSSSLRSFQSAKDGMGALPPPKKPWARGTPSSPASSTSRISSASGLTTASFETAHGAAQSNSNASGTSATSATILPRTPVGTRH